jgi:hypothetical protein
MVTTTLESRSRDEVLVRQLPTATIESYSFFLNAPGACTFTMPAEMLPDHNGDLTVPIGDVLEDGVHEVWVVRGGTPVFKSSLLTIDEQHADGVAQPIRFTAEGLWAYTRKWHVTSKLPNTNSDGHFLAVDQATIAKSLIDHHQAKGGGDFGIDTSNVELTGVLRDRTEYDPWRGVNVFETVAALAACENGFDFDVDPVTRQFRVYFPQRGRPMLNVTFDPSNIVAFGRSRDSSQQASSVLGFGDGMEELTVRTSRQDSTAIAKYGLTEKPYRAQGVSDVTTLDEQLRGVLDDSLESPNIITVTVRPTENMPFGSFWLGDEIQVLWPSPYRPVDEWRRVVGIEVIPQPDELLVVHLDVL